MKKSVKENKEKRKMKVNKCKESSKCFQKIKEKMKKCKKEGNNKCKIYCVKKECEIVKCEISSIFPRICQHLQNR